MLAMFFAHKQAQTSPPAATWQGSSLPIDPRRTAILLIGGDKTGHNRWYEEYVPLADAIYDQHLRELETE